MKNEKIGCSRTIFSGEKNWMLPHDFFGRKKLKCFFRISSISTNIHTHTPMVDPQHPARVRAPRPAPVRPAANVWDEYERITDEWNQSNRVQERYTDRNRMINNTAGYHTGNNMLHIRSIQMYNAPDWNALFGAEQLDPLLREYAQASIEYAQDETGTVPYAGQMEVSLIMQENYRGNIHRAILMIHLTPHRRFHDGHIIQKEFSEGSRTHQTINRLFDPNARAVVLQATQYQFLEYIADDDDAREVMTDYFMDADPDFTSMRFSYVADPDHDLGGYYVVNPNALDDHRLHYCADEDRYHNHHHYHAPEPEPAVAIPPPPPIYDIGEIYQRNIEMYYAQDEDDDEDDDIIRNEPRRQYDPERNIIRYMYNVEEDHHPVQG